MQLTSPAFSHGDEMPVPFTCLGANVNPPLNIVDVPQQTKSLVLIFEDIDATPKAWMHWMLFNIPPQIIGIEENAIPMGATEGLANNHSFGYEGPCPKYFSGTHHYWFHLYALDIILDLPPASEREAVEAAMQGHVIEQCDLQILCTSKVTETKTI